MKTTRKKASATPIIAQLSGILAEATSLAAIVGEPNSTAAVIRDDLKAAIKRVEALSEAAISLADVTDDVLGVEGYDATTTEPGDCECISDRPHVGEEGICEHVAARRAVKAFRALIEGSPTARQIGKMTGAEAAAFVRDCHRRMHGEGEAGPLARLRHHVTGAIERGEGQPIVEVRGGLRLAEARMLRKIASGIDGTATEKQILKVVALLEAPARES